MPQRIRSPVPANRSYAKSKIAISREMQHICDSKANCYLLMANCCSSDFRDLHRHRRVGHDRHRRRADRGHRRAASATIASTATASAHRRHLRTVATWTIRTIRSAAATVSRFASSRLKLGSASSSSKSPPPSKVMVSSPSAAWLRRRFARCARRLLHRRRQRLRLQRAALRRHLGALFAQDRLA